MAKGVNKVILVGHLGKDADMRHSPNGGTVTSISLATTESWKDKNTGEKQEKTEWHRIVFFGKLAEIAGQYLKKGAQIYIEGRLQTRKWQDKEGKDRYTTEIVAGEMQMLGGRTNAAPMPSTSGGGGDGYIPPGVHEKTGGNDFQEDDIPFVAKHGTF